MASAIQITYLHHSGFAVRTPETLLVFDDARAPSGGEDSLGTGYITPALIKAHRQTIFFASHAHGDHFSPHIFDLAGEGHVQYVLGDDIPEEYEGYHMHPGDTLSLYGVEVQAFDSTDEGVSFLVRADDWTIFHAGDLNLWHWRAESSVKEIEQAERAYFESVAPLEGIPIDFAFFPVDPRMGELFDAGALHFAMNIKPKVMIPMHWWERRDVAADFARRNRSKHVEMVALTTPGETIRAEKMSDGHIVIDW